MEVVFRETTSASDGGIQVLFLGKAKLDVAAVVVFNLKQVSNRIVVCRIVDAETVNGHC